MGCVIKYKGQSIPEEQFLQYLNKQIAINNLFNENETLDNAVYEALGFKTITYIPNYEVVTRPTKDIGKSNGRTGNFVEITTPDNYRTNMSAYMVQTNNEGKLFITNIEKYNEDSTFKGFGTVAYIDFFENYKNQGITTDKKLTADGIKLLERLEKIGLVYKTNAKLIDDTQVSKVYNTKIYEYDKPLYEFNLNWSKIQITPQQKQQAQQLYSQYLDTIFPDNRILYHSTVIPFDTFDKNKTTMPSRDMGEGLYVSDLNNTDTWKQYQDLNKDSAITKQKRRYIVDGLTKIFGKKPSYVDLSSILNNIKSSSEFKNKNSFLHKQVNDFFKEAVQLYGDNAANFAEINSYIENKIVEYYNITPYEALKFKEAKAYPVLVNTSNIKYVEDGYLEQGDYVDKSYTLIVEGSGDNIRQAVVPNPVKDSSMLGTEQDIEKFKQYVNDNIDAAPKSSDEEVEGIEDFSVITINNKNWNKFNYFLKRYGITKSPLGYMYSLTKEEQRNWNNYKAASFGKDPQGIRKGYTINKNLTLTKKKGTYYIYLQAYHSYEGFKDIFLIPVTIVTDDNRQAIKDAIKADKKARELRIKAFSKHLLFSERGVSPKQAASFMVMHLRREIIDYIKNHQHLKALNLNLKDFRLKSPIVDINELRDFVITIDSLLKDFDRVKFIKESLDTMRGNGMEEDHLSYTSEVLNALPDWALAKFSFEYDPSGTYLKTSSVAEDFKTDREDAVSAQLLITNFVKSHGSKFKVYKEDLKEYNEKILSDPVYVESNRNKAVQLINKFIGFATELCVKRSNQNSIIYTDKDTVKSMIVQSFYEAHSKLSSEIVHILETEYTNVFQVSTTLLNPTPLVHGGVLGGEQTITVGERGYHAFLHEYGHAIESTLLHNNLETAMKIRKFLADLTDAGVLKEVWIKDVFARDYSRDDTHELTAQFYALLLHKLGNKSSERDSAVLNSPLQYLYKVFTDNSEVLQDIFKKHFPDLVPKSADKDTDLNILQIIANYIREFVRKISGKVKVTNKKQLIVEALLSDYFNNLLHDKANFSKTLNILPRSYNDKSESDKLKAILGIDFAPKSVEEIEEDRKEELEKIATDIFPDTKVKQDEINAKYNKQLEELNSKLESESLDPEPKSLIQLAQYHNINTNGYGNLRNPTQQQLNSIEKDFQDNGYSLQVKAVRPNDRGDVSGFYLTYKGKRFNPHNQTVTQLNDNSKKTSYNLDNNLDSFDFAGRDPSEKYYKVLNNLDVKKKRLYENQKKLEKLGLMQEKALVTQEIEILKTQINNLEGERIYENLIAIADYEFEYIEKKLAGNINNMNIYDVEIMALTIDNWLSAVNYLSDLELLADNVVAKFREYQEKARSLADRTNDIRIALIEKYVKEEGEISDYKLAEDFGKLKDVNLFKRGFLDISRVNSQLLSIIQRNLMKADGMANRETAELLKELDVLFEQASNVDPKYIRLFLQRFSDGVNKTGNMVHEYSQSYFDALKYFSDKIDRATNDKERNAAIAKRNAFKNKYLVTIDYTLLYNNETTLFNSYHTDEEKNNYITYLKAVFGETKYASLKLLADKKVREFKRMHKDAMDNITNDPSLSADEKLEAKTRWNMQFNPFLRQQATKTGNKLVIKDTVIKFMNNKSLITAPKKFDGKSRTKWYDRNFETIQNNPELLALHTKLTQLFAELKSYLPEHIAKDLQVNTIPTLEKNIIEQFKSTDGYAGGIKLGFKGVYDELKKQRRVREETDVYNEKDIITEKSKHTLIPNIRGIDKDRINSLIKIAEAKWLVENPNASDLERIAFVAEEKRRATNLVANEKSEDLRKIAESYALMVLSYRHKSAMEDHVRLTSAILDTLQENVRNSDNTVVGKKESKESFSLIKSMYDDWLEVFYGKKDKPHVKLSSRKLIHGRKVRTAKELQEFNAIEEALDNLEKAYNENTITKKDYESSKDYLELRKLELHGVSAISKDLDLIMKFLYLKALAYNPFSAAVNASVGLFSNLIESTGGDIVSEGAYLAGIRIAYFGRVTDRGLLHAASALMEKTDLHKSIVHEVFNKNRVGANKYFEVLVPFWMQKKAEKSNQVPILIAHFLDTKVKNLAGEEKSLLSAFDNEGNWKVNEFGEAGDWDLVKGKKMANLITAIEQHIAKVHGNYSNTKLKAANRTAWGRAFNMFKTWLWEFVATNFESEHQDTILGKQVKGKLSTLYDVVTKSVWKDGIYTYARASDIDKANLKKDLTLFVLGYLALYGAKALIMAIAPPDDDDEEITYSEVLATVAINLLTRTETDLTAIINPFNATSLFRSISPVADFFKDLYLFGEATKKTIIDDEPEWTTGIYAGENRMWVRGSKLLPVVSPIKRNIDYATKELKK